MHIAHKAQLLILIILGTVLVSAGQVVTVDKGTTQKLDDPERIIVSVDAKGTFKLGDKPMTLPRLSRALSAALDKRTPPDRVIYLSAQPTVPFSQVIKVLKLGRTIGQDSFGLMSNDASAGDAANAVITKIKLETPGLGRDTVKPNPLYLAVAFLKSGGVKLNGESHTLTSLTTQLRNIFKDREDNGVYAEGTNDVDKTIFLSPSPTTTFRVLVQIALTVRDAGAEPVGIEIDPPRPLVMSSIGKL